MDNQEKFKPYSANNFYPDNRDMRPLPQGTVARGELRENPQVYMGKDELGEFINFIPIELDKDLMDRGQDMYKVYCSVCHGASGAGDGPVSYRGFIPPPRLFDPIIMERPDGYFFDAISNGIRNMPAYGSQIPVRDRWAIVAYLRALQMVQTGTAADLPPGVEPK